MADDQTRVWVGAFGKHPGWDDHLTDQGLETELLVRVKRLIYVEGIGGNLDAGAWDALDAEERRNGFDHVFLWRWAEGLIVGRMWSSSDGKGRTRYPMIVCAQARGLASSWVVGACLDRLERLAAECRASSDAGGVIMGVDRARQELRGLGAGAPPAKAEGVSGTPALVLLAECDAMGEGAEGLVRVGYQLEREFSSFLRNEEDTGQKSRTVDVRPRHMRVPACTKDAGQACDRWIRYLLDRVDVSTPILAMAPVDGGFVDVVVGVPTSGQFLCLQAALKRIPLSTDIPYTIDEEFRSQIRARIEKARLGTGRDRDPGVVSEVASVARRVVGQGVKTAGSKKNVGVVVGVVVVLVVIIVIAAMKMLSSGGQKPLKPVPPVVNNQTPATDYVASEAQISEFRAWCLAYNGWLRQFADDVQRRGDTVRLDDHFASRVMGPVVHAVAERVSLNPRDVVSNPPPTVTILAENVPNEIAKPEIMNKTQRATRLIGDVEEGLRSWPVRRTAEAMISQFESYRWSAPAEELRSFVTASLPGGSENLIDSASGLMRAIEAAAPLGNLVENLERSTKRMKASGDTVLSSEANAIASQLAAFASARSVQELSNSAAALEESEDLTRRIETVLDTTWANVDRDAFFTGSRAHTDAIVGSSEDRLRLWLAEVGQDVYQSLRAEDDPRPNLTAKRDLEAAQKDLDELQQRGGADATDAVGGLRERASTLAMKLEAVASLRWNRLTRQDVEQSSETLEREVRSLARDIGALRGSIETDATEYVLSQRGLGSISSDGLASIDAAWVSGRDALLARFEIDGSLVGLRRDLDRLRGGLRLVEESSRVELGLESAPSGWQIGLVRVAELGMRNSAVAEVVASWRQGIVEDENTVAARVAEVTAAWGHGMRDRLGVLRDVERRVSAMHAIDEPGADGRTLEVLLDEHFGAGQDQFGDWAMWESLAPSLWKRIEGLRAVRKARTDRTALMGLAVGAGLDDGARLDAWRSLAKESNAWPAQRSELEEAIELRSRIVTAASRLDDAQRVSQIRSEVDQNLARGWQRTADGAADWDEFISVLKLRERCGATIADANDAVRLRVLALHLRDAVRAEADDETNRAAIRESVRSHSLERMSTGWLAEVLAVVDEPTDGLPPLDPSAVGPARAGWAVDVASSEQTLVYTLGSGGAAERLEFRLVTDASGRTSYVSVQELSVGVVAALAASDETARRGLIESLGGTSDRQESRVGMLTWQWRASRDDVALGAAESWVAGTFEPQDYYVRPLRGAGPGRKHPFHRLGLSDALFIAGRLGCRLPTIDEWRAASNEVAGLELSGGWNLRDARVAEQAAHIRARLATPGWRGRLPDEGAFEGWRGEEAHTFNDEQLWVSAVDAGPEAAFRHLVGNVGEYVVLRSNDEDAYRAFGSNPKAVDADAARRLAREVGAGVIGGSVFSRADVSVFEPREAKDVIGGWSDVGVRLAFTGHARLSVAARVMAVLDKAAF
ncbi:MAG: hypothetical protein KF757_07200 [Phycisphaeraceae bacterium]|nr:hypothetical protein [Phycisphaeraceae bacterium]